PPRSTGPPRPPSASRASCRAVSAPTRLGTSRSGASSSTRHLTYAHPAGRPRPAPRRSRQSGGHRGAMRKYIIRRVLYAIPTLLGISVIVFAISRLATGDPVRLYTFGATNITEEDIAALRHIYGLDQPLPIQYVNWLVNMLRGDFGKS